MAGIASDLAVLERSAENAAKDINAIMERLRQNIYKMGISGRMASFEDTQDKLLRAKNQIGKLRHELSEATTEKRRLTGQLAELRREYDHAQRLRSLPEPRKVVLILFRGGPGDVTGSKIDGIVEREFGSIDTTNAAINRLVSEFPGLITRCYSGDNDGSGTDDRSACRHGDSHDDDREITTIDTTPDSPEVDNFG